MLRNNRLVLSFIIAYLIHLIIGVGHYLIFIDADYFTSDGQFLPLPHDFKVALSAINEIISTKHTKGLFHFVDFYIEHLQIWNLMSYPFFFFGGYILNIAPVNSFMSVFTSINIYILSKFILKYLNRDLKKILLLTAYFPITIISSIFFRDTVGLALISMSILIICLSRNKIYYFLTLLIGIYFFYMVRSVYPLILILAFFVDYRINSKTSQSLGQSIFTFVFFVLFFGLMLYTSFQLGFSEGDNLNYIDRARGVNYLFFPVKLIMGLIGPFPWTKYFTSGQIVYSYQFADYIQGAFNITVLFLMIKFKSSFFKISKFNLLNLTGIFLILSGLATVEMHSSYVSIGFIFLIPWIINSTSWIKLKIYFLRSFLFLLTSSLLIFLFFGSLGLGDLWK